MAELRSLRERVRRTGLGVKLAWLTAGLTALVVSGSFLVLSARIRDNTRHVFADDLGRTQRTLAQLQRRNFEQLLFGASLISTAPTLRAAIGSAREDELAGAAPNPSLVATVQRAAADLLRQSGKDLLVVTDDSGKVFAAAVNGATSIAPGINLSGMPALRHALDPAAPADSGRLAVLREPQGLFQVAVYPLVLDGYTLGAVLLGERLDSGFVAAARSGLGAQAVVSAGDEILMSTFASPSPVDARTLNALAADADADATGTVHAGGEEYVAASVSLGTTQAGVPVQLTLLQPLTQTVNALTRPVRLDFALYGAIAVLLVGFGAAFAAGSVLQPLARFVEYLRSGAAAAEMGPAFDPGDASVEMRTLSDSFTELMGSLNAKQGQLERRTAQLAAANSDLTEEVRERQRVESALRESEAQLRQSQKLEAVGTLAGGVAHDFNNLLTVISGYTQFAMRRVEPGTPGEEDLRQVVAASQRAANLTNQLLAFSRKQVLKPTVLDLGAVVDGVAPMLRRLIGEHIELTIERREPLSRILADRGQLEQVVINLAVNARDAMPNGGTLTLTTCDGRMANPSGGTLAGVLLQVRDTGIGIPAESLDRIFEPFFTTKEVGKGTGLGLSTVYGIVKQSGGAVSVESAVGAGTTFTVALPVASEVAVNGVHAEEPTNLPRGTETVLLVEDEAGVRHLARRTLEELGYVVVAAADPAAALEAARDVRVDVLLTDIVMPGMSGPQLAAKFRDVHPAPALIYMSGYSDDALPGFTVEATVSFLRKPFTPYQLARSVRDALDAR